MQEHNNDKWVRFAVDWLAVFYPAPLSTIAFVDLQP